MYPSGSTPGSDPFDLFGSAGDPFAPAPPAPAPSAPAPAASTEGAPTPLTTPGFVPVEDYTRLKTQVDSLKPLESLRWIAEAVGDSPEMQQRLRQAIFTAGTSVSAPPSVAPDPGAARARQEAEWRAKIDAKLAAGDVAGAMIESANMGAALATEAGRIQLEAAAGPYVTLTAQNAIEAFKNMKRANSPLFVKLESKFVAFVSQTPAATLQQLASTGQLNNALETAWNQIVGATYEQSYTRAAADGRLGQPAQPVPPYGTGTGGGPTPGGAPEAQTDEDKDDAEFVALARARGITINMGRHGEYVAEVK